jgi:hypothetical protein
MFATVEVRKNNSFETLCFRSKEDAQRFQAFVEAYMRESGAGNGYGAYWIFNRDVGFHERPPGGSVSTIDAARVGRMLWRILQARTCVDEPEMSSPRRATSEDGGILFDVGEFPPRQRPAIGDMFRAVGPGLNEQERDVGEGRVLADLGDWFEVVSCGDEEDDGNIKPGAKRVSVRADKVMKINDWKRKNRRG